MKKLLLIVVIISLVFSGCIRDRIKPYTILYRFKGKVKVQFNLDAKSATKVYLAGNFNDWTVPKYEEETFSDSEFRPYPMKKNSDGLWTVVVSLSPGMHYYKYWVDGMRWQLDEASHEKRQDLSGNWKNIVIVK